MNYYPRHIGDYVSATAHLSMVEDGAYNRLLDWYYQDERPLPADKRLIYRRVRAIAKPEREAVDAVLAEFFVLGEDGYRHRRCDAEIERNNDRANKARKSAEMRWQSERNANAYANASPEHTEGNALQKPKAKSQREPRLRAVSPRKQTLPENFGLSDAVRRWAQEHGYGDLDRHLQHFCGYARANGKTYADWDQALMNAIREDWARLRSGPQQQSLDVPLRSFV